MYIYTCIYTYIIIHTLCEEAFEHTLKGFLLGHTLRGNEWVLIRLCALGWQDWSKDTCYVYSCDFIIIHTNISIH